MSKYYLYPRAVYFDMDGFCIGAGVGGMEVARRTKHTEKTMELPSDHYDFLGPINYLGKVKEQIEAEVKVFMSKQEEVT